ELSCLARFFFGGNGRGLLCGGLGSGKLGAGFPRRVFAIRFGLRQFVEGSTSGFFFSRDTSRFFGGTARSLLLSRNPFGVETGGFFFRRNARSFLLSGNAGFFFGSDARRLFL